MRLWFSAYKIAPVVALGSVVGSALGWGCTAARSGSPDQETAIGGGISGDTGLPGDQPSSGSASDGASSADDGSGDSADPSAGDPPRLDVGSDPTAGDDGPQVDGCEKIDFLFVVDNSGSMGDDQVNLINSFDGFIAGIENVLMVDDYHIMVIDTDAFNSGSNCTQQTTTSDCADWCDSGCSPGCNCICNGNPCVMPDLGDCDQTLGGGKRLSKSDGDCGISGPQRFMMPGQPALESTFGCLAEVGSGGDGNERPMEAMNQAVNDLDEPGQCNEGFIRNDAILVVTVITDEEDSGKSPGNPGDWKQAVLAAKGGNEEAIVVLALIGDTGTAGATCTAGDDAENAPRLRQWAESFTFGSEGSVCAADYGPFFADAVSVIDVACEGFNPEG